MNHTLFLTILGLLLAHVAMERLADRALRANTAKWRAHYAAIPANAIVTANLRWSQGTWITAFVDEDADRTDSLQVVALRPLSAREQASCLRWLRAEGFADRMACGVPPRHEHDRDFDT